MRSFYFGCWREPGHYLWLPGMSKVGRADRGLLGDRPHGSGDPAKGEIPWGYGLDGGILKRARLNGAEGVAVVERRDGWTALSFWDRSVDSRGGSSSTFVFDVDLEPASALERARVTFPEVFARFDFKVTLA